MNSSEADDFVANVFVEIVGQVTSRADSYPKSWYLAVAEISSAPADEADRTYFKKLVTQICKRRLYDRIRTYHLGRLAATDSIDTMPDGSKSPESQVMLSQFMTRLAHAIQALTEDEQDLLMRSTERDEEDEPLTGAERIKILRLRRRLADRLIAEGMDARSVDGS